MSVNTGLAVVLVPNGWDNRQKSLTFGNREWKLALELVNRAGFRPNVVGGLSKRDVGPFANHLQRLVEQGSVPDADRPAIEELVKFLSGPGAGGFSITPGWKRAW